MRPAPFDYLAARDVCEVLGAFGPGRQVVLLSGGQSLVPALSRREIRPDLVVDLNAVAALDLCAGTDRVLRLGALTRHRWLELDDVVGRRLPVLAAAAALIGDPGVRRRGSLGGSLAHAQPGAQLPVVAVLLDAQLRLAGAAGERGVAAAQFFRGPFRTGLGPDEMLLSVDFPWTGSDEVCAIHCFGAQRYGRMITAAVRMRRDASGRCGSVRIVVGVGRPVAVDSAGSEILGRADVPDALLRSVASRAAVAVAEMDDDAGPDDLRLAGAAVGAALAQAWRRPTTGA